MKHGDIVLVGGRKGVALNVSLSDITRGVPSKRVQVSKPGTYVFAGYWYGQDPLNHANYGKILGDAGTVIGRVACHNAVKHFHKV